MFILPRNPDLVRTGVHSLWKPRLYPGTPDTTVRVRADLRCDLSRLPGLAPDLMDSVVLCASEIFANACDHSRSGEEEGRVIRTLATPDERTLRLSVIDDGYRDTDIDTRPRIPHQRTAEEWEDAERGRGLLIVSHLATRWGTSRVVDFPFCEGLGTVIWADFALPVPAAADAPASSVVSSAADVPTAPAPEAVR
ncbi:ATP-binding protein [Nocardiopsis quinghaiensis]|uniref:ATP-binding protein n=1 Tax=Nocardiopsis quinghaiensis TaxID=464995 RepID=UPI00123AEE7F|nr:ATP-binding protein [Nocardiopsis quinghaiensis]